MFILHTANLYLDKPFFACSHREYGQIRRKKQREVFQSIIQKVFEYKADALLITGNLFDSECITEQTFSFLWEQFESIMPVPILIVPGDSDPINEYSPYMVENFPDNVVIMNLNARKRWEADKIPLVVYALTDENIKETSIKEFDIPSNTDGKNHILTTYNLPISDSKDDVSYWFEKLPYVISYVAVGKGNGFKQMYSSSKRIACCCGLPNPICFDDKPPFGVLGIQFQLLNNRWEVSKVEHISTQQFVQEVRDIDLTSTINTEELLAQLRSEFNKVVKPCFIHIRLWGTISPHILKNIPETIESLQEEGVFLTWSIEGDIEGFENPEDIREVTVLSEFFKQALEEKKYAPNPSLCRMVSRATHLAVRVAEEITLKIPAVESCEVPQEWNS